MIGTNSDHLLLINATMAGENQQVADQKGKEQTRYSYPKKQFEIVKNRFTDEFFKKGK